MHIYGIGGFLVRPGLYYYQRDAAEKCQRTHVWIIAWADRKLIARLHRLGCVLMQCASFTETS